MTKVSKRKLIISVVCSLVILLSGAQLVFSINTLTEGYQITSAARDIRGYSSCYTVNANDGNQYFFPTNSSNEFFSFVNNKPAGVTIKACQVLEGGIHTDSDCIAAGGTVSNNYCRFSSCPSGWTASSYKDYTGGMGATCGMRTVHCNSPSGVQFGGWCTPWGNSQSFTTSAPSAGTCTYADVNDYPGTYGVPGQICSYVYRCTNQFSCGGFPYSCGYQNVCGLVYECTNTTVYQYGTICSGTAWRTCSTNNSNVTAAYCY